MILLLLQSYLKIVFYNWIYMNSWKRVISHKVDVLNPILKVILAFGWVEVLHNELYLYVYCAIMILLLIESNWELLLSMWMHMNFWKRMYFYKFWCTECNSWSILASGWVEVIYYGLFLKFYDALMISLL